VRADRQVLDLQHGALLAAGDDRAGRAAALAFLRLGDCLVAWKLDRLGRSLPHRLTVVNDREARGASARPEGRPRICTAPL
jgi:DNA invertase Pin-like site-specific DNA recombinase